MQNLQDLYEHFKYQNKPSLIRRVYGLYRLTGLTSYGFQPVYFVVYRNNVVIPRASNQIALKFEFATGDNQLMSP